MDERSRPAALFAIFAFSLSPSAPISSLPISFRGRSQFVVGVRDQDADPRIEKRSSRVDATQVSGTHPLVSTNVFATKKVAPWLRCLAWPDCYLSSYPLPRTSIQQHTARYELVSRRRSARSRPSSMPSLPCSLGIASSRDITSSLQ